MSDYEEQIEGSLVICPYCEESYQRECEDYSEESSVETCYNCGKKYRTYESFSVDTHTIPDCDLNANDHKWETHRDPNFQHCDVCGDCRVTPSSRHTGSR